MVCWLLSKMIGWLFGGIWIVFKVIFLERMVWFGGDMVLFCKW